MRIREVGGVGVRLTLLQVGVSTDPASTLVADAACPFDEPWGAENTD
jgi:hypothetical protein